jgi:signal recognition particle subunit SEC65
LRLNCFYELSFLFKNEDENQPLSCKLHDNTILWYAFHRCTPVGISTVCLCRMVLVVYKILSTSRTYSKMHLVQHASFPDSWYGFYVQKDAFGSTCIFFMISGNLENILKIQKIRSVWPSFGRSGRRPSSGRRVPRGTCSCICAHVIFTIARAITLAIVCAIVFRDRVHDRTNDLFNRSRVRTPGLAHDLFCRSRVRFPDPIFCFRPILSVAYVTRPHD